MASPYNDLKRGGKMQTARMAEGRKAITRIAGEEGSAALLQDLAGWGNETTTARATFFNKFGNDEHGRAAKIAILASFSHFGVRKLKGFGFKVGQDLHTSARKFKLRPHDSVYKRSESSGRRGKYTALIETLWRRYSYESSGGRTRIAFGA